MVNERAVCILLECILVLYYIRVFSELNSTEFCRILFLVILKMKIIEIVFYKCELTDQVKLAYAMRINIILQTVIQVFMDN